MSSLHGPRRVGSLSLALVLVVAAHLLGKGQTVPSNTLRWVEVVPGLWASAGQPRAYALTEQGRGLVFDLPTPEHLDALRAIGVVQVERVLLTHHHRHTAAGALEASRRGIPVAGPEAEASLLTAEGVKSYWQQSLPIRGPRFDYFVVGRGIPRLELVGDGTTFAWGSWQIRAVSTPGHSVGHMSYLASKAGRPTILIAGDLLAGAGCVWSPFTLEWDHWTDRGCQVHLESLRQILAQRPEILCPSHGPIIRTDAELALRTTEERLQEVAFLKSFERFTKQRRGAPPSYRFLAPEQVATGGEKPFTQLSEHLWITGNTYILVSDSGATLAVDLWGRRSVDRVWELIRRHRWKPPEVVLISHAHYDHFDGIYELAPEHSFEVWTLGEVADVVGEPYRYRHPYSDARPLVVRRRLRPGETVPWHEYRFFVLHLPGQTEFTMGLETQIDGKRCLFTADNFFHMDQFSGSGGWTGLNRALPDGYARSSQLVLERRPDWVLAEHGGPFEFDPEDFQRRRSWAEAAAQAADRLCPSGNRAADWDPHRVACEPVLCNVDPGAQRDVLLRVRYPFAKPWSVELDPSAAAEVLTEFRVEGDAQRRFLKLRVRADARPGRYPLPLVVREGREPVPSDTFVVLQVREVAP
jgi:glyoxylase-like metal-dependent hydrolase (beta-lactamase superfamily II)